MFSEEELEFLNSFTNSFSRRIKHVKVQSFEDFIGEWIRFVEAVENGYTMTIDDYVNDLLQRQQIEELTSELPPNLKSRVKNIVDKWDSRFDKATVELKKPIFTEGDQPWWRYRLPRKLVGDLKEDVERLGIN